MPTTSNEELVRKDGTLVLDLLPEEIVEDENVRPFEDPNSEAEIEEIERLAHDIKVNGQLQPGRVEEVDNNGVIEYHLVMGHRRRRAIAFHNLALPKGQTPLKFRVEVQQQGSADRYRQALAENIQRKNFSPMEIAYHIRRIRDKYGWKGEKGTPKVAEYMGVHRSTITQTEKYNDLPADLQRELHEGKITGAGALELADARKKANLSDEQVQAVSAAAKENAAADTGRKTGSGKGKNAKDAVKAKHVRQALREVVPDSTPAEKGPMSKKAIIEDFEALNGPAYGDENSPVRKFLTYATEKYWPGNGTYRTFEQLFDAMVGVTSDEKKTAKQAAKEQAKADAEAEKEREKLEKAAKKGANDATSRKNAASAKKSPAAKTRAAG